MPRSTADRHSRPFDGGTLLETCVGYVDQFNPELNAVICDLRDDARHRQAATRGDPGRWAGPLADVPVSVKDVFAVQGTPTSNGAAYHRDTVADTDAPIIRAIRAAGGLIHAKDNLSELSCGATNANETFGDCRNPWDTSRVPGGSSGGSAVSVASGMTVVAYGTDAGGSVRIPAALTGVVGLRPTTGRLPNGRGEGVPQPMPDFSTAGPLARRVTDIARAFAAVDRYVPGDPSSVPHHRDTVSDALGTGIAGLRVGIPDQHFFDECGPGVAEAADTALAELEALGAVLRRIELPGAAAAHQMLTTMMLPQYVSVTGGRFQRAPETFGADVRERLAVGAEVTAVDYVDAMRWRAGWKRTLSSAFETVDLIATPTVPVVAPLRNSDDMIAATRVLSRNTYAWSLADVPAMSVPCGFADGLPVGIQLTAAPWREATLIRAGDAYQRATDWHLAVPPRGADPYRG
ncbi:MAG: amidase [Micromonosporaceae bacterium]